MATSNAFIPDARAFQCIVVSEPEQPELTQGWNQRCVPYWIRRNDPVLDESMEGLVTESFATWSDRLACTDIELLFVGYTDAAGGFDASEPDAQQNVILATRDETERNLYFGGDDGILAITITSFAVETGEIFDSDIILNSAQNRFGVIEAASQCRFREQAFDIQNTLVHEVGHFLGFEHVPNQDATMFAVANVCETSKRDLDTDDIDGVCTVYPTGGPLATCAPPASYELSSGDASRFRNQCERALEDGCGCRGTPGAPPSATTLGLLSGVFALWAWREGRRRTSQGGDRRAIESRTGAS